MAVVSFLLQVPLRGAAYEFAKAVRTPIGAATFVLYMAVHLLLYGFLLDAILASIYGVGASVGAGVYVTTNLFSPASLASLASDVAFNPVVVLTAPPVFSAALSFYSVSAASVIAVLVVANIGRTVELGRVGRATGKGRTFVVLPAIGVVFGASCCLSVAGLISLATPAASVLAASPWIFYATYFLFPCVAAAVLYLNLRSMRGATVG